MISWRVALLRLTDRPIYVLLLRRTPTIIEKPVEGAISRAHTLIAAKTHAAQCPLVIAPYRADKTLARIA